MTDTVMRRPISVFLLVVLFIGYGLFELARGVFNAFESPALVAWPVLAASLVTTLISSGLDILAGLMMFARRRAGWMLAGVLLCAGLIGGLLGSLQMWLMQVNNQPLYTLSPGVLYGNLLWMLVSVCLLFVLYSHSVRSWLNVRISSISRNLAGMLGLGLLLTLALAGIVLLAVWLSSLMS